MFVLLSFTCISALWCYQTEAVKELGFSLHSWGQQRVFLFFLKVSFIIVSQLINSCTLGCWKKKKTKTKHRNLMVSIIGWLQKVRFSRWSSLIFTQTANKEYDVLWNNLCTSCAILNSNSMQKKKFYFPDMWIRKFFHSKYCLFCFCGVVLDCRARASVEKAHDVAAVSTGRLNC